MTGTALAPSPSPPGTPADAPSGWGWAAVCPASTLAERGDGSRFVWRDQAARQWPAFALRVGGEVRAYLNRCAHVPVELDGEPGRFFDDSGLYLICATHGALYEPSSGLCVGGPCRGKRLQPLVCTEHDEHVWILMNLEAR